MLVININIEFNIIIKNITKISKIIVCWNQGRELFSEYKDI